MMTSIIDQYEASISQKSLNRANDNISTPEPKTSGYINANYPEDEIPIFSKSKINFKPQEPITHLSICNNMLCMVMSGRLLLRINLLHPDDIDEVEIVHGNESVYKMYFDPTGRYLLLVLNSDETLFLSTNSRKPKSLNKFKGHKIESLAWCRTAEGNTTGPLLVGTNWGLIMECCIETGEETRFFAGSVDQYFKQVFNLGKGEGSSVIGLEYFCTGTRSDGKHEYCVFAITANRLFQFSGTIVPNSGDIPLFQSVFSPYAKSPPRYIDLPGSIDNSQLYLHYNLKSATAQIPIQFAWLTSAGVYVGDIKVPTNKPDSSIRQRTLISNARLISCPDTAEDNINPFAEGANKILNIVLTDFHLLLLYSDRLKVICSLNEQLIFEDVYTSRYGDLVGLFKDPTQSTLWTFTQRAVFKYKVVKESRDVWQMYLDMEKFDLAREYCRDNPANLDKVITRQAEHAFDHGKYQESALYYAITQNSFEEISLKFLRANKEIALRAFLQKKLSNLKPEERTQMILLSTWLVELYLNQLGRMKEEGAGEEMMRCRESLRKLFAQNRLKECFQENRNTIYNLLISHGNIEDYVFFAVIMQDYERVVNHHIQNEDFSAALDALRKQINIPLYYKFSPVLMQHIPKETIDTLIFLEARIKPLNLIPALINCTQTHQRDQCIRYLEFCTSTLNCRETAIHNYLLSLYVKHKPNLVSRYLKEQGEDPTKVCYDVKYALRLCLGGEGGEVLNEACVIVYTVMGLYEEAVAMALKVNVEEAKRIANRELGDEELRRKLWLTIARFIVEEEQNIGRAMRFLQESGDLLKISDILPFFPDFVTISHFKDALCESLAEYNKEIDELKEDMNDATNSAHSIRENIQETRNRHMVVGGTERCMSCNRQLLTRAFYLFPCQHAFHNDCLWRDVRPFLIDSKRAIADRIEKDLKNLNLNSDDAKTNQQKRKERQTLIKRLDETIANECILCGEVAIRTVDLPFSDDSNTSESWT